MAMITKKEALQQKTFLYALEKAFAYAGPEVLCVERQLYALVSDYLGNNPQVKQSINLLKNAMHAGILPRLYDVE
ncbi:MAG: hypothetical protein RR728_10760 [Oscillospiraceae bacterium]